MLVKRLLAAAAVSALSVIGIAPAATAAPSSSDTRIVKVDKKSTVQIPVSKGSIKPSPIQTNAIDWD